MNRSIFAAYKVWIGLIVALLLGVLAIFLAAIKNDMYIVLIIGSLLITTLSVNRAAHVPKGKD